MTGQPYSIKRDGSLWRVINRDGNIMFSSLRRANCRDWAERFYRNTEGTV
jgi:hypothetical protein